MYKLPKIKDTNPIGQVQIDFFTNNRTGLPDFIVYSDNRLIIKPT